MRGIVKYKRYWRHYEQAGVSPIIATIMLVAITLILVAILWLWISGLLALPKQSPRLTGYVISGERNYTVMIDDVTHFAPRVATVKYHIRAPAPAKTVVAKGNVGDTYSAPWFENIIFIDRNQNGKIDRDDEFRIKKQEYGGIATDGSTLILVYRPTGDIILDIELR